VPVPTREDTSNVTVSVDGRALGLFDNISGGELDSEENLYNPGGMIGEISIGGRSTIGNVTVERYYDALRDHPLMAWLANRRGWGRVTVGVTPRDAQGTVRGDPLTYTGTLKTVSPPELDSTGSDMATWGLEITCDGFTGPQ
jgi:hypothetical protein